MKKYLIEKLKALRQLFVIRCKKSYSRNEVITLINKCLEATGGEIKTTMHIKKSYVEFDGKDLKSWIEHNV